jgi:hypothetical protein
MKASVQYNDMVGTAAADIADVLNNNLIDLAKSQGINLERYEPVGLSLYGVNGLLPSFLCIDKQLSTPDEEHLVKLHVEPWNAVELIALFKRIEIVLFHRTRLEYEERDFNREVTQGEE